MYNTTIRHVTAQGMYNSWYKIIQNIWQMIFSQTFMARNSCKRTATFALQLFEKKKYKGEF